MLVLFVIGFKAILSVVETGFLGDSNNFIDIISHSITYIWHVIDNLSVFVWIKAS